MWWEIKSLHVNLIYHNLNKSKKIILVLRVHLGKDFTKLSLDIVLV